MTSARGPRGRSARKPSGGQIQLALNEWQISFDKIAFSEFIKGQGLIIEHYRAMPDPRGMFDRGDGYAIVNGVRRSSDGMIYKKAGEAAALFSSNSNDWNIQIDGNIQHAVAVMTLPDAYNDSKEPFLVTPLDRFYIKDVEARVINYQYMEASETGIDQLQFPATCVELLIDSDGVEYKENVDFKITPEGDIQWVGGRRPSVNLASGKGKVYAIRYRYVPFFIVARLIHEIRYSQITSPDGRERKVERMPYQVMVVREYVYRDIANDPDQKIIDRRLQYKPSAGGAVGPDPSGTLGRKA
jgi:hypothetical protein